jgi:hypothetical protein
MNINKWFISAGIVFSAHLVLLFLFTDSPVYSPGGGTSASSGAICPDGVTEPESFSYFQRLISKEELAGFRALPSLPPDYSFTFGNNWYPSLKAFLKHLHDQCAALSLTSQNLLDNVGIFDLVVQCVEICVKHSTMCELKDSQKQIVTSSVSSSFNEETGICTVNGQYYLSCNCNSRSSSQTTYEDVVVTQVNENFGEILNNLW